MENSPLSNEDDTEDVEDKSSDGKKKKNAEAIGLFAVEPVEEKTDIQPGSFWRRLVGEPTQVEQPSAEAAAEQAAEPPLEALSPDEVHYVEREIVQAQGSESLPQADEHDPDAALRLAAAESVNVFRSKIAEADMDAQAALAETLAELGVAESEVQAQEAEAPSGPAAETFSASFEEDGEDENLTMPTPPTAAAGHQPPPQPPQPLQSPPGGGAGGGQGGHGFAAGGFNQPPGGPVNPNQPNAPNQTAPNPVQRVEYVDTSNEIGMFFLGGILGYLIGRRRGRIKTEKKLLPIQKKLEKQVRGIQQDLAAKETVIRQAAVKQARERHWQRHERPSSPAHMQEKPSETDRERQVAADARALHGAPPERIGQVLVAAEAIPASTRQHQESLHAAPVSAKREAITSQRQVETMSRDELLSMSEKISVEGSSLRRIYETNLVSEKGLRHLVEVHLAGGDIKRALNREIAWREHNFERDRQRRLPVDAPAKAASSNVGEALAASVINTPGDAAGAETNPFLVSRQQQAGVEAKARKRRRMMDLSFVVVIAVLFVLVLMLYMTR